MHLSTYWTTYCIHVALQTELTLLCRCDTFYVYVFSPLSFLLYLDCRSVWMSEVYKELQNSIVCSLCSAPKET